MVKCYYISCRFNAEREWVPQSWYTWVKLNPRLSVDNRPWGWLCYTQVKLNPCLSVDKRPWGWLWRRDGHPSMSVCWILPPCRLSRRETPSTRLVPQDTAGWCEGLWQGSRVHQQTGLWRGATVVPSRSSIETPSSCDKTKCDVQWEGINYTSS